ncbi:YbjN domain-containing protein [Corynebacterium phoceense]|uniref:YbjN domain-containing protein n=1 Tax=Corynebacterium phoceense TaxID=1686286 RepID=A0A540RA80_9CORY|nr:YbjN domain-containing protein [Corynebacterium phoceense]TQE44642.1 YbjN domain-containing protein [Corynebacterium phoceense]
MTPDSSSVAFPATTDTARPLTFDRVVDVVDALIDHFKSDADKAEITFRLSKFNVLIALAGKWGEVLLVKGTLNASVEPCLAGYLAQTINDMNTRRMVPVAYTSVTERGYLLTHLRASLDAEAWVTDAQLRDFLDTAIGTMVDSVRELSEAVPEVVGPPDGYAEAMGEAPITTPQPVTADRIRAALSAEGIVHTQVSEDEMTVRCRIEGRWTFFRIINDGRWLTIRTFSQDKGELSQLFAISAVLDDYNAGDASLLASATVHEDEVQVSLARNWLIGNGMTAAQLRYAVHTAVHGAYISFESLEPQLAPLLAPLLAPQLPEITRTVEAEDAIQLFAADSDTADDPAEDEDWVDEDWEEWEDEDYVERPVDPNQMGLDLGLTDDEAEKAEDAAEEDERGEDGTTPQAE